MKTRIRFSAASASVVLALVPAGCSASTTTGSTTSGNGGSGPGNGGGGGSGAVTFNLQITFTGPDSVQGSLTDNESGSGFSSCAEFASGDSVGFVQGPAAPIQSNHQVGGKSLQFSFEIGKDRFHGPATYTGGVLVANGVTIGNDTFFGSDRR